MRHLLLPLALLAFGCNSGDSPTGPSSSQDETGSSPQSTTMLTSGQADAGTSSNAQTEVQSSTESGATAGSAAAAAPTNNGTALTNVGSGQLRLNAEQMRILAELPHRRAAMRGQTAPAAPDAISAPTPDEPSAEENDLLRQLEQAAEGQLNLQVPDLNPEDLQPLPPRAPGSPVLARLDEAGVCGLHHHPPVATDVHDLSDGRKLHIVTCAEGRYQNAMELWTEQEGDYTALQATDRPNRVFAGNGSFEFSEGKVLWTRLGRAEGGCGTYKVMEIEGQNLVTAETRAQDCAAPSTGEAATWPILEG